MSESTVETKNNGNKRWFSETNLAICTLLVTNLLVMLGFFYHVSSGIATNSELIIQTNTRIDETNTRIDETNKLIVETNKRVDETNKLIVETNTRIDESNKRIDGLQNLFAGLSVSFGKLENSDENQNKLIAQLISDFKEFNERLSDLESAQAGESQ